MHRDCRRTRHGTELVVPSLSEIKLCADPDADGPAPSACRAAILTGNRIGAGVARAVSDLSSVLLAADGLTGFR
jgi:hypothetical protein